jgi:hypothetical protein
MGTNDDSSQLPEASQDAVDPRHSHVLGLDGKPKTVVMRNTGLLRLQKVQKDEILAQFDSLLERLSEQNAAFTDEDVAVDIEKARGG